MTKIFFYIIFPVALFFGSLWYNVIFSEWVNSKVNSDLLFNITFFICMWLIPATPILFYKFYLSKKENISFFVKIAITLSVIAVLLAIFPILIYLFLGILAHSK